MTIGSTIRFDYIQNNMLTENVVGRVVKVRDTEVDPILDKSKSAYRIRRSLLLLTVAIPNGDKTEYKSFYDDCMHKVRHLTPIERLLYWLRGINFPSIVTV